MVEHEEDEVDALLSFEGGKHLIIWFFDFGASKHMTNRSLFITFVEDKSNIDCNLR